MFDNVNIYFCDHHANRVRIIPWLGPAKEQTEPVVKTPQFQKTFCQHHLQESLIMATSMSSSQKRNIRIKNFVDKKGNPAKVDGAPEWTTDNSEVLALTPADDGMSCVVAAVGPLSNASITVTADADMGAGVKPIIGTMEFEITAGEAVSVDLEADEPEEQ